MACTGCARRYVASLGSLGIDTGINDSNGASKLPSIFAPVAIQARISSICSASSASESLGIRSAGSLVINRSHNSPSPCGKTTSEPCASLSLVPMTARFDSPEIKSDPAVAIEYPPWASCASWHPTHRSISRLAIRPSLGCKTSGVSVNKA